MSAPVNALQTGSAMTTIMVDPVCCYCLITFRIWYSMPSRISVCR